MERTSAVQSNSRPIGDANVSVQTRLYLDSERAEDDFDEQADLEMPRSLLVRERHR